MGLWMAAWVAASWLVWDGPWPLEIGPPSWSSGVGRPIAWAVVSLWTLHGLRRPPPGFVLAGRLAWSGGRGELVSPDGVVRRGATRLRWQSPLLVGVTIDDPTAGPLTLWLTPWRLGERGWWRLQRFLTLART
ncbi:MAG TPA: hypothetical protein ENO14_04000 [Chromatiales bacterium]|nr:hypothetical protein [Chromatiales bacterium]